MKEWLLQQLLDLLRDSLPTLGFSTVAAAGALLLLAMLFVSIVLGTLQKHTPVVMMLACLLAGMAWYNLPSSPATVTEERVVYRDPPPAPKIVEKIVEVPTGPDPEELRKAAEELRAAQEEQARLDAEKERLAEEARRAEKARLAQEEREREYQLALQRKREIRARNDQAAYMMDVMFWSELDGLLAQEQIAEQQRRMQWNRMMRPHTVTLPPGSHPKR